MSPNAHAWRMRWHDTLVNLAAHPVGFPLARAARLLSPALSVPGFGLVISDAELSHQVLVRDRDFTKNGEGSLSATVTEILGPSALSNMDGESHQRLRSTLADLVSPTQANVLLRGIVEPLETLKDTLRRGEPVDLVQYMQWMSGRITYDMLGVLPPGADARAACLELVALGLRVTRGLDLRRPSADMLARVRRDCEQLVALAHDGFHAPDAPAGSFVRRLRELGLSFDEARGVIGIVFLAGTLTTAAALPRIVALLVDSGQFADLRAAPEHIPAAVAEGLRFTSPVPATMRIAAHDTELDGRRIRAGTRVIVLTANLTRDRAMFERPAAFESRRAQPPRSRNLWYGAGPHFCLGFAIAQRQLQMVLEGLATVDGTLRIVKRTRSRGVIVPAYRRLELVLDASQS